MDFNKTKYLIIVLIALFFASTNELCAKEAKENYKTENHTFIVTDNFVLSVPYFTQQKDDAKTISIFSSSNYQLNLYSYFDLLPNNHSKSITFLIIQDIYLNNLNLRI